MSHYRVSFEVDTNLGQAYFAIIFAASTVLDPASN